MWNIVIEKIKTKKYRLLIGAYFLFFMSMYMILDHFNGGYQKMMNDFGVYLVFINLLLDLVMSLMSAFMMGLSTALFKLSGKEGKGSSFGFISFFFGILTYGCTSCVIAFFATIGITFSVIALPLAGLPYKFISLGIILLGFVWLRYDITHIKCKI